MLPLYINNYTNYSFPVLFYFVSYTSTKGFFMHDRYIIGYRCVLYLYITSLISREWYDDVALYFMMDISYKIQLSSFC